MQTLSGSTYVLLEHRTNVPIPMVQLISTHPLRRAVLDLFDEYNFWSKLLRSSYTFSYTAREFFLQRSLDKIVKKNWCVRLIKFVLAVQYCKCRIQRINSAGMCCTDFSLPRGLTIFFSWNILVLNSELIESIVYFFKFRRLPACFYPSSLHRDHFHRI